MVEGGGEEIGVCVCSSGKENILENYQQNKEMSSIIRVL